MKNKQMLSVSNEFQYQKLFNFISFSIIDCQHCIAVKAAVS